MRPLRGDGGAEEVVRLEPVPLARDHPRRLDQPWQQIQLLEDLGVEIPPGLVRLEQLVAIRRHADRVPADDDRPRPLRLPQALEHRHEPDQRIRRPTVVTPERARQSMEGAVREGVAVDCEQGLHESVPSSSAIATVSRSVAAWAASSSGIDPRSASSIGSPYATRSCARCESPSVPEIPAGTSGTPASSARPFRRRLFRSLLRRLDSRELSSRSPQPSSASKR